MEVSLHFGIRCAGSRLVGLSRLLAEEFCFLHHSNFRCRADPELAARKLVELASVVQNADKKDCDIELETIEAGVSRPNVAS